MGERRWTETEDRILLEGRKKGVTFPQIAQQIGRTLKACEHRYSDFFEGNYSDTHSQREIREGSRLLADSINALIDRMPANDVAEMLGKPHLKMVERAPYKTQSALRELAA